MSASSTVTIRISASLKTRLNKLADATARSRSFLAAHALQLYVDDQEWQIAAIRKGRREIREGRFVSHEKVSRWLRSWGKQRQPRPPSCE